MELEELKKKYEGLSGKYKLPSFKELNENFEIDKIEMDSDALLRSVRKVMMEKIINSLGFVEMLLNPMNSPRMYLSYIRSMGQEDKKCIEDIYGALAEVSVAALEAEINYSEEREASLIKEILKVWNKIKPEFNTILKNMKSPAGNNIKKDRSYFG